MSKGEFYSSPEKIFRRLADYHHISLADASDALVAAKGSPRKWKKVPGASDHLAVRYNGPGHWKIRIGPARRSS